MTQEYRVDLKVRNNIILCKIEQAGYKTLGEFLRLNNLKNLQSELGEIINMTKSPLTFEGEFRSCVVRLSKALDCDPLDLFSDTQFHTILKTNKRAIKVNEAEMRFMIENSEPKTKLLEEVIEEEQKNKLVHELTDELTAREKQIIQMRFGLGDYDKEYTLQEVAEVFGLSKDRIRQIEARALRIMRHPSRTEKIKRFLHPDIKCFHKFRTDYNAKDESGINTFEQKCIDCGLINKGIK